MGFLDTVGLQVEQIDRKLSLKLMVTAVSLVCSYVEGWKSVRMCAYSSTVHRNPHSMYTADYCSAVKMDGRLPSAAMWMGLEKHYRNRNHQAQKTKMHVLTFIWKLKRGSQRERE